jgi:hypothetical protein
MRSEDETKTKNLPVSDGGLPDAGRANVCIRDFEKRTATRTAGPIVSGYLLLFLARKS